MSEKLLKLIQLLGRCDYYEARLGSYLLEIPRELGAALLFCRHKGFQLSRYGGSEGHDEGPSFLSCHLLDRSRNVQDTGCASWPFF